MELVTAALAQATSKIQHWLYFLIFCPPQGPVASASAPPPSAPAGGCPPPPPPGPPPPPMDISGPPDSGGDSAPDNHNALFASINKGFDITKSKYSEWVKHAQSNKSKYSVQKHGFCCYNSTVYPLTPPHFQAWSMWVTNRRPTRIPPWGLRVLQYVLDQNLSLAPPPDPPPRPPPWPPSWPPCWSWMGRSGKWWVVCSLTLKTDRPANTEQSCFCGF